MTLEPILNGVDIFAQAETGSGKTGAFAIPILEQIMRDDKHGNIEAHESRYAIISPTRELAQQTHKVFQMFGKELGIESCCIVGGESMDKQKELIGNGIHVLVATPGRFVDLIKQKVVSLNHCKAVVFDEADRLFDMGFKKDIEYILTKAPKDRQLIMVSATNNQDVLRTAYKFHSDPTELKLNEDSLLVDHINHKIAMVSEDEKFPLLVNTLRNKKDVYAIIFCNTQVQTHLVAEWLVLMNFKAKAISGKLAQNKRTKLMEDFRAKKVMVLVCTDVAARGLDIKDVNLVINYDLPQEAANYVHRIGRTGRAGEAGEAISFCAYRDCEYLDPISELIDTKIEKLDLEDSDFATDIAPRPYVDRKTMKVVEPRKRPVRKERPERVERKPREKEVNTKPREESMKKELNNKPRIDKRFFEIKSHNMKDARSKAMRYLNIDDDSLLGHDVLKTGSRKFIIFGAKEQTLKFFVKPIFKKLLLPFLIEMMKIANLRIFVKVSYKPGNLVVSFSGEDEKMLSDNRFELLQSIEHITTTYLQSKVVLERNLSVEFRCPGSKAKPRPKSKNTKSKKDESAHLIKMVEGVREQVVTSQEPQLLKPLNSHERRLIHQHLAKDKELQSNSVGDGRYKQVEIAPRD